MEGLDANCFPAGESAGWSVYVLAHRKLEESPCGFNFCMKSAVSLVVGKEEW